MRSSSRTYLSSARWGRCRLKQLKQNSAIPDIGRKHSRVRFELGVNQRNATMAAKAEDALPQSTPQHHSAQGQDIATVLLFVTSTDNTGAQLRALNALNRHSGIVRAAFAPDTTRLIRVEYRTRYADVAQILDTAKLYAGVGLRPLG